MIEMKARIRYEFISTEKNSYGKEGYAVEIMTDEGWVLDSFFPLYERAGAQKDEGRNFVHFGILNKFRELQRIGYDVEIK